MFSLDSASEARADDLHTVNEKLSSTDTYIAYTFLMRIETKGDDKKLSKNQTGIAIDIYLLSSVKRFY
jgi:hypothetical protein